jgi:TetR/AcrR family transcriptional repressor of bet genes
MAKPAFTRAEPDARRLSLIEATARVLAERGASGVSVRAISVEAGVSPGLIGHYFDGIDALVAATYAHVDARVAAALDAATESAEPSPRARLLAHVTASFAPPIADPAVLATWIAFWSLVKAKPEIAHLHGKFYAAYRRRLEALLAECGVPAADLRMAAIGITALVDGLWLELCLAPETFTPNEASAITERQIDTIVSAR